MERGSRFAQSVAFVLDDGEVVYPVRRTNRETWMQTFRVGLAPDALDGIVEITHEDDLIAMVLHRRCVVRCASSDGKRQGMFSPDHRQVARVLVSEHESEH